MEYKNIKVILNIFILFLLTGCAAKSINDLSSNSDDAVNFNVSNGYIETFTFLDNRMRQCWDSKHTGVTRHNVESSVNKDKKKGVISFKVDDVGGGYILSIKIISSEKDSSNVIVSYRSAWKQQAYPVKRWINENYLLCSSHKPNSDGKGTTVLDKQHSFSVGANYLSVYKEISLGMRSCHDANHVGGYGHIHAILESDKNKGTVTSTSVGGMFAASYNSRIVVEEVNENQSKVTIKYKDSAKKSTLVVQKWIEENYEKCKL